jgi:acyl-CoA reductase-like NAD-dependent aldehyde dehydrogenase
MFHQEDVMDEPSQIARTKVAGVEVSTAHWIDGRRVPSNRTFEVLSPIDGSHLANASAGGTEEVDAAVAAARWALAGWAGIGPQVRLPGSCNSGIGREGGDWSMDFHCDIKNVSVLKNSLS